MERLRRHWAPGLTTVNAGPMSSPCRAKPRVLCRSNCSGSGDADADDDADDGAADNDDADADDADNSADDDDDGRR